jgi:hypothetical protein
MKTKFGALILGLMFLASIVAPAMAVDYPNVIFEPASGSTHADRIQILDSQGYIIKDKITNTDGTVEFTMPHGTFTAKLWVGTTSKDVSLVIDDSTQDPTIIQYTINAGSLPAKPVLTVTASGTDANLIWTYSGAAIDGFNIARDNVKITTVGPTVTTYTDAGLVAGTTYKYIITAYNTAGSTPSDEVSVTIPQNGTTGDLIVYDLNFKDSVAPGSSQTYDLELKNVATYDAEDVTATIIIHNIGANKDDLKTDVDFGTISSGDKQTESVSITIPQDADDKLYTVSVDLKWKDSDGNHYTGTYTSPDKLEVVKVKHQISITNVQEDAAKYKAGDTVQLAVSLLDSGANAETVQLKANSDIGASATGPSFKMNEGDATTQYLSFTVPDNAKAGKYFVVVTAAYSNTYSTKSIVLEVASNEAPTTVAVVEQPKTPGTGIPATDIALAVVIILLIGAVGWLAKDIILPQKAVKPIAVRARR